MTVQRIVRILSIAAVAAVAAGCSSPESKKTKHFEAGNALVAQNKHAEAIIEYRHALKIDEQFGEARMKLGKAYEETQDYARALREYVRAADLMPESADAQLAAGRFLVLAGQFEDAKERAERVLETDPKSARANLLLGSALVGLKDVDGAIRQVEDAVSLDPLDAQSRTTLGVLALAKGDVTRAQQAFEEAVRLSPQSIEARVSLSSFHWIQRRPEDAEKGLKEAFAIEPQNELVNRALVAFYIQSNRRPEAEPHLKALAARGDPRTRLTLADYYTSMGRASEATEMLKALESDKALGGQASVRLAMIAYAEKRPSDAHRIVDALIATGNESAQAALMKGRFLLAEKRIEAAIESLRAAVKADPKLAAGHYILGNALQANNDLAGASNAYRAALELVPGSSPVQLELARVSLLRGDSQASLSAATTAVEKQPENPIARVMLVDALLARRDTTRAAAEVAALKAKYPKVAAVHVLEGKLQGLEKKYAESARAFERALTLDSNSVDAATGLVGIDLARGDHATAIKRAEALLAQRPSEPTIRMLAARAYLAGREQQKAEGILEALVREQPENTGALTTLADVYLSQGKRALALERYDVLAAREPKSIAVHTVRGMLLQQDKRIPEAKKAYETALEVGPDAAVAANNLAWILADERQDLDRALMLANKANLLRPNDPHVADTIGWVYYQKQLPTLAVAPFERAVELAPKNPEFQYHLGMALAAVGESAKARTHLHNALALSPTFSGASAARDLLATLKN